MTTSRFLYGMYLALIVVTACTAMLLGLTLVQTLVVLPAIMVGYLRARFDSARAAVDPSSETLPEHIAPEALVSGGLAMAIVPEAHDGDETGTEDDLEDFMAGNH